MTVQKSRTIAAEKLNIELENILKESQYDMQERTRLILLEIETIAASAKKDVKCHIDGLISSH